MAIAVPDTPPVVLCFAPGDPTGGGGLVSDILTLSSMGCHPLAVQTAAVVRDTRNVDDVLPADGETLVEQARAVLEDIPVAAFKVGFCGSVENIARVAEVVSDYPEVPLVLEPALYAGVDAEEDEEAVAALAELIVPQTTLLVAGRHEICRLAGIDDGDDQDDDADGGEGAGADEADVQEAVARLLESGTEYVLLTSGGEQGPQVVNRLYGPEGLVRTDAWDRLPGRYLGAGATLAAAAASALAHGMAMPEAVREAQEFAQQTLRHAYRPGMGRAVPDRFFWARGREADDA
ncbi:MAG: bifunctional hydroxymethylpyrimidine kinase/phosphomethylpyrimidine kinase [Thauera sp.]|nr:bifunctional hydroxymethylpyrimidine kinase/phosphomethylpyrimidine kinase [Thauera sp.]